MKIGLKCFTAVAALALMGNAIAASITVPTLVIVKGTTMNLNLDYTGDATTTNFSFTINYDETVVDETALTIDCTNKPPEQTALSCSVNTAANTIGGIGVNIGSTALSSTNSFAVVSLPILAGAATGDSVNTFTARFYDAGAVSTGDQVDVPWTVTVSAGPQPVFGSAPTAAAGVSLAGQISTTIQSNVLINNNAGDDGSTLNYTCIESSDPSSKFTISGQTTNIDVAKGNSATVTVACDSSAIGGPFTGQMSCAHNGSNTSPALFALSCTVNAGPEPAFTGTPSGLAMVAAEEGDANPSGSLTITNTGDAETTLTGTCGLSGDPQISLTGGAFSVAQGTAGATLPVACDASAQGNYSATLSCTHNGTNTASPVNYGVTCEVGPPGPAIFASVPAPGSIINMTPTEVPVGGTVANQVLTIRNDAPEANDRDLELSGCAFVGDPQITATAPSTTIAPMGSTSVTFSCDSANVGAYSGTYSCNYAETGGAGPVAVASYTVNCGIRAAEAEIGFTPAPNSTLNITVPVNGTGATFINISEVNDEGVDASIESCTLADGANFEIITAFPFVVPAGGTVQIQIEGTDPGNGGLNFTDTITCNGTDSSGPVSASWLLNLNVQIAAIPTLSTLGLLAMILTMFGFGGIMIRRKIGS